MADGKAVRVADGVRDDEDEGIGHDERDGVADGLTYRVLEGIESKLERGFEKAELPGVANEPDEGSTEGEINSVAEAEDRGLTSSNTSLSCSNAYRDKHDGFDGTESNTLAHASPSEQSADFEHARGCSICVPKSTKIRLHTQKNRPSHAGAHSSKWRQDKVSLLQSESSRHGSPVNPLPGNGVALAGLYPGRCRLFL